MEFVAIGIEVFIALFEHAHTERKFDRIDEKFDRLDKKFDRIDEKFDRIDEKFDRNERIMRRGFEKNQKEIQKNFRAIKKNYEAIREVGSKVDRNFDKMIGLFANTEKTLEKIDNNIKNQFDALRKSMRETRIETVTSEITFAIERMMSKNILIYRLTEEEIPIFFEESGGINWFLDNKETLHKKLHEMIENSSKYIKPNDADDNVAQKGMEILLVALKAYYAINLNLINSYKYMANYHYKLSNIDTLNNYLLTLASTIKDFEINFIGVDGNIGLIENVKKILNEIENYDFIRNERPDLIQFIMENRLVIEQFKTDFYKIKSQLSFLERKPIFRIQYDFNRSNVSTPFEKWVDHQKVSYAMQYKNGTDLSLISEWSDTYGIYQKGCPYLTLDDNYTGGVERVIFRKFLNYKPELAATIENKDKKEFRDIDRDLFNSVVLEANEELAIRDLNFLIKNGANINATFENQKSLVHYVCEKNRSNLLLSLIKNNASIDLSDKDGRQPLHIATENNSKGIVQILLDHGADVNAKTNLKWTPIHYAFKTGNKEIASLLINKGSNVTLTTENDFNVFHIATSSGKANMINLDKIKNIDINAKSSKGLNVLHLSVIGEHTSLVETLLNNTQIDVNAVSEGKLSTLHLSAASGNLEITKQLLKHKDINVNQLTSDGWSALQLAILSEKGEVALELIKQKDIDINLEGQSKLTPIHLATMKNMTSVASELLKKKVRLEKRDSNGFTSLHLATMNGYRDIVELLVYDGKASLNVKDKEGNTPLMTSVLNRQFEMVQFLVREDSRIGERNNNGYNAIDISASKNVKIFQYMKEKAKNQNLNYTLNSLDLACFANQPNIVQIMIDDESKEILKFNDIKKNSVLHHASYGGSVEMMKFLLEEPNNLTTISNQTNIDGDNILHIAAANQNFKLVRCLNSKNVDLNKLNQDQFTPILKAAEQGSWPIVEYLIKDKKINPSLKNKEGDSLLHYAARDNQKVVIDYLLGELKFEIDQLNQEGYTPLSYSVKNGHLKLVQYLIEQKNANYKLVDKSGHPILHLAVESGNLELVQYFVEQKGLNVISPANTTSCLHLSAKYKHLEILKYLLTKQSNIDAIDENVNTPLMIAGKSKNWEIVEYLIKQNANTELLDSERNSIIHEIATSGRVDLLKLLKNKKISEEKRLKNSQGMTAMHNSARSPDSTLEMLQYLVEELRFVFDQDNLGNTPAHYSANDLEMIRYLSEEFYIDKQNKNWKTPCTLTEDLKISQFLIEEKNADYNNDPFQNVVENNLGVLKYLIEVQGMDPNNVKDEKGRTVLIHSAMNNHLALVQYLAGDLKMDVNKEDITGNDATFYADLNNYFKVLSFLDEMNNKLSSIQPKYNDIFKSIENNDLKGVIYYIRFKNVDPNLKDSSKDSLLHLASRKSNVETVKYLVQKGADLYARNTWNNLPLHESSIHGVLDTLKYFILDKKMDPNLRGSDNWTTLHWAVWLNSIEKVKFLVENTQIDINAKNLWGKTALDIAIRDGHREIADYLRKPHQIKNDFNLKTLNYQKTDHRKLLPHSIQNKKILFKPNEKLINSDADPLKRKESNLRVQNLDLQSTLMLFNVLVRKLTNEKFITEYREPSLTEVKMTALNIIDSFERMIEKMSNQFKISIEDFDPTKLISTLTWHLRNGELNKIPGLLVDALNKNEQEFGFKEKLEIEIKKILIKECKTILPEKNKATGTPASFRFPNDNFMIRNESLLESTKMKRIQLINQEK